jgi:hypothetical protein
MKSSIIHVMKPSFRLYLLIVILTAASLVTRLANAKKQRVLEDFIAERAAAYLAIPDSQATITISSQWKTHVGMHKEVVHSVDVDREPNIDAYAVDVLLVQLIPTIVYFDHFEFTRNANSLKSSTEYVNIYTDSSHVDSESIYESSNHDNYRGNRGRRFPLFQPPSIDLFAIELLNVTSNAQVGITFHTRYHEAVSDVSLSADSNSSDESTKLRFVIPDIVVLSRRRSVDSIRNKHIFTYNSETNPNSRKQFSTVISGNKSNLLLVDYSIGEKYGENLFLYGDLISRYRNDSSTTFDIGKEHSLVMLCNYESQSHHICNETAISFNNRKHLKTSFPVSSNRHAALITTVTSVVILLTALLTARSHLYC